MPELPVVLAEEQNSHISEPPVRLPDTPALAEAAAIKKALGAGKEPDQFPSGGKPHLIGSAASAAVIAILTEGYQPRACRL
jgi:hypothetical protein